MTCRLLSLSISDDLATKLGRQVLDVETGPGTALKSRQKDILRTSRHPSATTLPPHFEEFVNNPDSNLGLIELREISNTKATLWITEAFLSALLRLAKLIAGMGQERSWWS